MCRTTRPSPPGWKATSTATRVSLMTRSPRIASRRRGSAAIAQSWTWVHLSTKQGAPNAAWVTSTVPELSEPLIWRFCSVPGDPAPNRASRAIPKPLAPPTSVATAWSKPLTWRFCSATGDHARSQRHHPRLDPRGRLLAVRGRMDSSTGPPVLLRGHVRERRPSTHRTSAGSGASRCASWIAARVSVGRVGCVLYSVPRRSLTIGYSRSGDNMLPPDA